MSNKTNPMDVRTDFDRYKERHQETKTNPLHGKEKWIAGIIIIAVIIFLCLFPFISSCSRKPKLELINVQKITIYKEGTAGTTFSYTDAGKIEKLTGYIESLDFKSTTRTPNGPQEFYTGGWQINMNVKIQTAPLAMEIVGNKFFQDPTGVWWLIPEDEAVGFEELLRSIVPDEMPQTPLFDEWTAASLATRELMQNVSSKARSFMEIP